MSAPVTQALRQSGSLFGEMGHLVRVNGFWEEGWRNVPAQLQDETIGALRDLETLVENLIRKNGLAACVGKCSSRLARLAHISWKISLDCVTFVLTKLSSDEDPDPRSPGGNGRRKREILQSYIVTDTLVVYLIRDVANVDLPRDLFEQGCASLTMGLSHHSHIAKSNMLDAIKASSELIAPMSIGSFGQDCIFDPIDYIFSLSRDDVSNGAVLACDTLSASDSDVDMDLCKLRLLNSEHGVMNNLPCRALDLESTIGSLVKETVQRNARDFLIRSWLSLQSPQLGDARFGIDMAEVTGLKAESVKASSHCCFDNRSAERSVDCGPVLRSQLDIRIPRLDEEDICKSQFGAGSVAGLYGRHGDRISYAGVNVRAEKLASSVELLNIMGESTFSLHPVWQA